MEPDDTPTPAKKPRAPRLSKIEHALQIAATHENPAMLLELIDAGELALDIVDCEADKVRVQREANVAWKKANAERLRFVEAMAGQPDSTKAAVRAAVQSRMPKRKPRASGTPSESDTMDERTA